MDKETFRKFGHEFVDWVVDYLDSVEKYPVRAQIKPGEIINRLPDSAPVPLSLVCFRVNNGGSEEELNALNKELIERINQSGKVLLTQTTLKGKFVLRMAIGSRTTEERHVCQAWELIVSTAKNMLGKNE